MTETCLHLKLEINNWEHTKSVASTKIEVHIIQIFILQPNTTKTTQLFVIHIQTRSLSPFTFRIRICHHGISLHFNTHSLFRATEETLQVLLLDDKIVHKMITMDWKVKVILGPSGYIMIFMPEAGWVLFTQHLLQHNYVCIQQFLSPEGHVPMDIWGLFYKHGLTGIKTWTTNHTHTFLWDVITHPSPTCNSNLSKLPVKLWHGWVTTSHCLPPTVCMDIISYICHNPDVGLTNLLLKGFPNL